MTCESVRLLLQAALDDRLADAEAAAIAAHAVDCDACRAYEAGLARVHRGLAATAPAPAALMQRLGLEDAPPAPRRGVPAWAFGAAAAALVAVGVSLAQFSPAPTPVAEVEAESVLSWLEPDMPNEVELPSDALFLETP